MKFIASTGSPDQLPESTNISIVIVSIVLVLSVAILLIIIKAYRTMEKKKRLVNDIAGNDDFFGVLIRTIFSTFKFEII